MDGSGHQRYTVRYGFCFSSRYTDKHPQPTFNPRHYSQSNRCAYQSWVSPSFSIFCSRFEICLFHCSRRLILKTFPLLNEPYYCFFHGVSMFFEEPHANLLRIKDVSGLLILPGITDTWLRVAYLTISCFRKSTLRICKTRNEHSSCINAML